MSNQFKKQIKSHPLVLVDFFATWCKPCKIISPMLEEIVKDTRGKVQVIKIDLDKNQRLAAELNIKSVPTICFYKYGKLQWRKSGVQTKLELMNRIKGFL
ncbi:MAG: thioredoxin [Bacteroidota bacterium]